jgi:hypothetical protein
LVVGVAGISGCCIVYLTRYGPKSTIYTSAEASDALTSIADERAICQLVDRNLVKKCYSFVNLIGVHLVLDRAITSVVEGVWNEGIG